MVGISGEGGGGGDGLGSCALGFGFGLGFGRGGRSLGWLDSNTAGSAEVELSVVNPRASADDPPLPLPVPLARLPPRDPRDPLLPPLPPLVPVPSSSRGCFVGLPDAIGDPGHFLAMACFA